MKIALVEFVVLLDALSVSTRIQDGDGLYNYAKETRESVWKILHERMKAVEVDVAEEEKHEP